MSLLEQYKKEIAIDLAIDEVNIKASSIQLPAKKHHWVARLIEAKQQYNSLTYKKKQLKKDTIQKIIQNSLVRLTASEAEKAVEDTASIVELNKQIDEVSLIVEYLEKVEKIFQNMTWDYKNIIQLYFSERS